MTRIRSTRTERQEGGGAYFDAPASSLRFVKSGCILLDLVLGGGYALGRMANIIGDKSTGKTLLAIEAFTNFFKQYPNGLGEYDEAESAFDDNYAAALGMPVDRIKRESPRTVEEFAKNLKAFCIACKKKGEPGIFVLDSMDALSDTAEMAREFGEASYGTGKAKANSELFRKLIGDVETSDVCLIIISQIRDNIGTMFGDKTKRAGGHALDFYGSQFIKLAHLKQLVATKNGQKRVTGIRIKAKNTKNKIALPFRECEFVIRFAYGIENYEAAMEWLIAAGRAKDMGLTKTAAEALLDDSVDWDAETYAERSAELESVVVKVWYDIERTFLPTRKKYS